MTPLFTPTEIQNLLRWFDAEAVRYPWGENSSFYRVWISEIMLQQTQVAAVVPFFRRWMERFPTLDSLAAAEEEAVLRAWEGLGYYSRARNIHKAARKIAAGEIPETYAELVVLPGIGDYTASAILSIVYGKSEPVIDANVKRIYCRIRQLECWPEKDTPKIRAALTASFGDFDPGRVNSAVMQLGQILCRKKSPRCENCPFAGRCKAFMSGEPERWPLPKKKNITEKTTPVYVLASGGRLLLERPEKGIGSGLWRFPQRPPCKLGPPDRELSPRLHTYTRYRDRLLPRLHLVSETLEDGENLRWIPASDLDSWPMLPVYRKIAGEVLEVLLKPINVK